MGDAIIAFLDTWSPIDLVLIAQNFDRFLLGAWVTLQLTFLSLVVGGCIAVPLAIIRAGNNPLLNAPVWAFTYTFRGTPLLVQTYLFYYGLGQFEWIRESFAWGPVLSQAWWCALIAFSLNTAAYTTELLRGAIESTNRGEVEAAKACGFSKRMRLKRIVLPSAFRRALPAYSNEVIFMLHGSVVASTITIQDLLGVGRWLNGRYYLAYEGFITAAVLYLVIVLVISRGFRMWEKNWLQHLYPHDAVKTNPKKGLANFRI
ncbi:MAG: ABC transporter permease [Gammaproteobacteria bacterium]|nr:ABC transporter permease [Gammaproteobacteria bacterium]MDH3534981.1 ABC transporter permease [Gammaproteobacteria bacterium]